MSPRCTDCNWKDDQLSRTTPTELYVYNARFLITLSSVPHAHPGSTDSRRLLGPGHHRRVSANTSARSPRIGYGTVDNVTVVRRHGVSNIALFQFSPRHHSKVKCLVLDVERSRTSGANNTRDRVAGFSCHGIRRLRGNKGVVQRERVTSGGAVGTRYAAVVDRRGVILLRKTLFMMIVAHLMPWVQEQFGQRY